MATRKDKSSISAYATDPRASEYDSHADWMKANRPDELKDMELMDRWMAETTKASGLGHLPDFTDQIIQAVQRSEAQRRQQGRTLSSAFGPQYLYGGMFPIAPRGGM